MIKYNKRRYNKDMAIVSAKKAQVRTELDAIQDAHEAANGAWDNVLFESWDKLTDLLYRIEVAERYIERKFASRHWTAADYNTYALIAANID